MKLLQIEGMSCQHCKNRVEKALMSVGGVQSATVDLKKNTATVDCAETVAFSLLKEAVEDAGYEVVSHDA